MYFYQMLYQIYRMVSRVSASLRESCSLGVVVSGAVLTQTLALHSNLALGVAKVIHLLQSISEIKDLNRTAITMPGHCKSPVPAGFQWFAVET